MKKSAHKKPASTEKKHYLLHWSIEFFIGFAIAAALAFIFVNIFSEQTYDVLMNVLGL